MKFAADCLAATGLDSTQLGIVFAIALGAIAVGLAFFGRSWRNRAALALTPLLILAGIASMGGLALASSSPAQAAASCETATPTAEPTGNAPVLQAIVYGDYDGSPYTPATYYGDLDGSTIYLPGCFWTSTSIASTFMQQITASGDGPISYTATGLTAPDTVTTGGLVSFNPTTFGDRFYGSFDFIVTATSAFGEDAQTYTVEVGCAG
jgi:hypothetical protein